MEQSLRNLKEQMDLLDKNGNIDTGIHCNLFRFYLSLGKSQTNFDSKLEAINTIQK